MEEYYIESTIPKRMIEESAIDMIQSTKIGVSRRLMENVIEKDLSELVFCISFEEGYENYNGLLYKDNEVYKIKGTLAVLTKEVNMDIPNYDYYKLQSGRDNEKILCSCDQCGEDIFDGDESTLVIDGDTIHEDCFYDYAWKKLEPKRISS